MSDDVLKGNFNVKKPVKAEEKQENLSIKEQLKKRALASLGGSMVYVERKKVNWDGDE